MRRLFIHQQSILRFDDGLAWLMQVTTTDSCGLGGTPWGRADYLGHVSLIGWDEAGQHDLLRDALYRSYVHHRAGDSYSISCTGLEDRRYPLGRRHISTAARPAGTRRLGNITASWSRHLCSRLFGDNIANGFVLSPFSARSL
jgi:hypothetical protein